MTLTYSLSENDFLQHQLYVASKTKRVKSQRLRSWFLVTISFVILSFLFYENDNELLAYYFSAFGILSLFLYPLYLRFYYRKHYQIFIAETYRNRFNEIATVKFTENNIETFDKTGEAKIYYSELQEVAETGGHFYLRMKTGTSLIIPKLKIEQVDDLRKTLHDLANRLNIPFISELGWRWK